MVSVNYQPKVKISFNKRLKETKDLQDKIVNINDIVDVKGDKAKGNQLSKLKIKEIILMDVQDGEDWPDEEDSMENNLLKIDESTENIIEKVNLNSKLDEVKQKKFKKLRIL